MVGINLWDCPFVEVIKIETAEGYYLCYRCNNLKNKSDYCYGYNGNGQCKFKDKPDDTR